MTGVVRRARPEKCPVCRGRGVVKKGMEIRVEYVPCHGCKGKGWVTVYDEIVYYPERKDKPARVR